MGNYGFNALKERKCKKCGLEWIGRMPCPKCSGRWKESLNEVSKRANEK